MKFSTILRYSKVKNRLLVLLLPFTILIISSQLKIYNVIGIIPFTLVCVVGIIVIIKSWLFLDKVDEEAPDAWRKEWHTSRRKSQFHIRLGE